MTSSGGEPEPTTAEGPPGWPDKYCCIGCLQADIKRLNKALARAETQAAQVATVYADFRGEVRDAVRAQWRSNPVVADSEVVAAVHRVCVQAARYRAALAKYGAHKDEPADIPSACLPVCQCGFQEASEQARAALEEAPDAQ